mmetsp:Transcript_1392/g.1569  ORF Transcript_1392/g.1569 Transcript_1392/m.1569 type:complete len:372 (-) Transcript_1392:104-1219(-)
MWSVLYPIRNVVSHVWVVMVHLNFHSETALAFLEPPLSHLFKQFKVLFDRSVSIRGLDHILSAFAHLFSGLVADVCLAFLDKLDCVVVQLLEVVTAKRHLVRLVSQPPHVGLDVVDVLLALFLRVGVIVPQVAVAVVIRSHCEAEPHRLGVADMQISIWLWREPRDNLPSCDFEVFLHDFFGVTAAVHVSAHELTDLLLFVRLQVVLLFLFLNFIFSRFFLFRLFLYILWFLSENFDCFAVDRVHDDLAVSPLQSLPSLVDESGEFKVPGLLFNRGFVLGKELADEFINFCFRDDYADSTIFFELDDVERIHALQGLDGCGESVCRVDLFVPHVLYEELRVVVDAFRQFSREKVKQVSNVLIRSLDLSEID